MRCLIVDDNDPFLEIASASLARDGLQVVGTAKTSAEALLQVERERPDVVLVDVNLGGENGFELAHQLVEMFPELRLSVVLISTRDADDYGSLVTTSPAAGFVRKTHLSAKAIQEVVSARDLSEPEGR
jgi:DNA-binding NarL/FixJ family response regulator